MEFDVMGNLKCQNQKKLSRFHLAQKEKKVGSGGAKDVGRLFALWLVFLMPSLDLCGLTGEKAHWVIGAALYYQKARR